jgi:hypothetical protein
MNGTDFSNLNFNRPRRTIPRRAIWMGGLLVGVGLAWNILPSGAFFWLALIVIIVLGWAASYGWRASLRDLVAILDRLQNL